MTDDATGRRNDVAGAAAMASLKILVIDDEPDVADVAGALLGAHGIAFLVAYSAKDGLHAIENDPLINVVFSDIMMPGMTGLDLADAIQAHHPWIRVVLTSGFTSPDMLAAHRKSYGFIPKPYRIEALIDLLHQESGSPQART